MHWDKDKRRYIISIHALREEGDLELLDALRDTSRISIHALREEGDLITVALLLVSVISIHALREEGDPQKRITESIAIIFLSTPSARRATIMASTTYAQQWLFLSTPSARRATAASTTRAS